MLNSLHIAANSVGHPKSQTGKRCCCESLNLGSLPHACCEPKPALEFACLILYSMIFHAPPPRVVTTGRKKPYRQPEFSGIDTDTGEPIELLSNGRKLLVTRHLKTEDAVPASVAFIDALAFSVTPPDEHSYIWVLKEMSQFLDLGELQYRRGLFGFRNSARFGDGAGVIAWGGDSQNGRVYFSLMGQGCARITDWSALAEWLEQHRAVIKRADVAYDDFEGKLVSIAWAVQQYQGEGFNAGGRRPRSECIGDWLDGDSGRYGRTLGIGNRISGKYCRIYEKGKQLGDSISPWVRVEVEWRAQDRYIPYDVLTRPGHYLAGAYPCLAFLSEDQSVIKTIAKGAQIAFDRAIENAKQACGKLVNLALEVFGGDYVEVVNRLIRPGYPRRINPYIYHVKRSPSMLDSMMQGAPS